MGNGFRKRNRIVVATAAEPGKSSPEIVPPGVGVGVAVGVGVEVGVGLGVVVGIGVGVGVEVGVGVGVGAEVGVGDGIAESGGGTSFDTPHAVSIAIPNNALATPASPRRIRGMP